MSGTTCPTPLPQPNSGGAFVGAVNAFGQQVPAVGNQSITNCPGTTSDHTRTNPTVTRLSNNASRFGVSGTESLGGGLSAVFLLEQAAFPDTGNSPAFGFASRAAFVGLQGPSGRLVMGKFLMPMDDLNAIFGNVPTLLTSILSTADVWAQGALIKGQGSFDARIGNSIRYDSPNLGGFTAALQASTRDDSGNTDQAPYGGDNGDHPSVVRHAWVIGGNAIYSNGPLQVGFGFEANRKVRQYEAVSGTYNGQNCAANACILNANDWDYTVAGAYDFGTLFQGVGLTLAFAYEQTKYETPSGSLKRNFWAVSGTLPVGAGKLYLFFGKASDGKGSATDGETVGFVVHGANTGTGQWEISYSYSLSPRTMLYAGYVKLLNDRYNRTTFNINPYPTSICKFGDSTCSQGRPSGFVVGMVHFF